MSDANKAIAACVAYATAHAEVQRLTRVIGDALYACATAHDKKYDGWDTDGGEYPPMWESHLKQAYAYEDHEETQYTSGGRDYLTAEEQAEVLAECPHCLAAHHAIQQRKAARKAFGAAKRYVGSIGRRAHPTTSQQSKDPA